MLDVLLLDDLLATAYAVSRLNAEDPHIISAGKPEANGSVTVIALVFLNCSESCRLARSSEGGHAGFAPTDQHQAALWR